MAEAFALGRKKSEVAPVPRGQVYLVDELPVIHQEVELEAVEVGPLAGDEAAVGPVREEAGAGGADVLAGGEGEGVQSVGLGLVEVLPDLGREVEEVKGKDRQRTWLVGASRSSTIELLWLA